MKSLPKITFIIYSLTLLWLVLFKFSTNIPEVLNVHIQNLNLIPFADSQSHLLEVIENFIVFVPLGLLLSTHLKRMTVWQKLTCIFVSSVLVETIQFTLAIGVADITDIITNTLGGLAGLILYRLGDRYADTEQLDQAIAVVSIFLLAVLFWFRFFVFRVRY